ncbi:COG3650 family protein [Aequorivita echinoideorum]|uniref:Lipoprotein n=1 Tax=Aequorivita echinoideorum TaxID=1549647 RepID=A0ABS5S4P8_9FLAO|nr:hypothetical protein [Aequorivita echinoideorum]MBT0608197.1 hypothetical protein [Aequorivita echinoideorum]
MKIKFLAFFAIATLLFASCKNSNEENQQISEDPAPTESPSTSQAEEIHQDIPPVESIESGIMRGGGGEPFWSIKLTASIIRFQSERNDFKEFTAPLGDPTNTANGTTYTSKNENGTITVTLLRETCKDGMSGQNHTHKISVELQNKNGITSQFSGCGSYLKAE